ncbi:hypothetical protein NC653_017184 [Populus alba x Populus x berolinensis]|uniref:Uncharacterized protein n=1 Tax=Populus alba x Populus x berolinensis TaxID=444605 RepID=A0AAD6W0M0_9ROSI|nr:hypothetical protein NC653_017184 [Populus alba x Populus x berolinensis]
MRKFTGSQSADDNLHRHQKKKEKLQGKGDFDYR